MLSIDASKRADMLGKLSILFVDDDAEVRESMSRYLAQRVGKVYTAHNGAAGLSSCRSLHPDLVIADVGMDGMDGIAMCRAIRETEPTLPMIFISAHDERDVLLSSIDLGVTKFIVKPVRARVLMDTIATVAQTLERQRDQESKLRQMSSLQNEAEYESESVRSYVSRYLEAGHHDEISNVRHLNIPKLGVSGDFYSMVRHNDDLYVLLADGAGHGLSAVLPALQIPRIFQQQAERGFSLLTIAAELNRALYEQRFVGHFVAATLIRLNAREHFIKVLNCGNPPVLIFNDHGELLHSCHSKSTALGMLGEEAFSVEVERFNVEQDMRVYLFTDGLVDTLQAGVADFDISKLQGLFGGTGSAGGFDEAALQVWEAARNCKVDDVTLLEIHVDWGASQGSVVERAPEYPSPSEVETPVALNQMTMLYVEDDEVTRDYLALYLSRRLGMVHTARDGEEGLSLFIEHRPQIVLSDIKMPKMNGLAMSEEIRKLDEDVPIILIGGSDNAVDAEKMFEIGVSGFQMKPFSPNKLTDTVQACIRQANMKNRQRLSFSAFQTSSLAVITTGRDKRIIAVNPAFCRMTGYTLYEVIGHSPVLFSAAKYDASYYRAIWDALDKSGHWSGELLCRHKNGETVSEWLTVNAVNGGDGGLKGYHFIFADIAERRMNEEKVRQQSLRDYLTGLPNRAMFAETVNGLLLLSQQIIGDLALLYINIDRFIEINNALGVSAGDEILLVVAQRLLGAKVVTEGAVCRLGGDEFAVLMRGDGGRESIERYVVELSRAVSRPIFVREQEVQIQISVGVGMYPADGATYEDLIKNACSAMNQAQHAGGDTYRFFDKKIGQREGRLLTLRQHIKSGLQKDEFYMLYQPKYSLSQQRVVGAEALVRWQHPTFGLVSPAEFIPLAESNGTVIEMSEWIIGTVCRQLADWRRKGLRQVPVSINISPLHFWRGDLVGSLQGALQKWGISPDQLPIEVTEGVVMDSSARTLQVLGTLKELGFKLSIDDFGTGYSSLKYLKDMPINELKIDRSFVIEIPEDGQLDNLAKTAIPRAIIQLASELNLTVVAEGVETASQKKFLLEHGCDVIQGFLFSRPVPADEFALFLP